MKKYRVTRYCIYVRDEKNLLIINLKNGAILMITKNTNEIFKLLEKAADESCLSEKELKILIKNGILLDSGRDEVSEAKQYYDLYIHKNKMEHSFMFGIKIKGKIKGRLEEIRGFTARERIKNLVIKLYLDETFNNDLFQEEFADFYNYITSLDCNMIIKLESINYVPEKFIEKYSKIIVEQKYYILHSEKFLLKKIKEIKRKYGNCLVTEYCEMEEFTEKIMNNERIYLNENSEIEKNVDAKVINEVLFLDSGVVKEYGLKQIPWFRPLGLKCEYSFTNSCYLNDKGEILLCPYVESNLKISDVLSEKMNIKLDNKCYKCQVFYFCMGNICWQMKASKCPHKLKFIKDYAEQLLQYFLKEKEGGNNV